MKYSVRWLALLVMVCLVGCGEPARAPVTGKVSFAGKGPLTGGSIRFVSESNPEIASGGLIKADGSYEVVDAPVGDCKVLIETEHLRVGGKTAGAAVPGYLSGNKSSGPPPGTSDKMKNPPKGVDVPGGETDGGGAVGLKYMKISPDYANLELTPLKATVERGGGGHNFEVK
jgi:hypothetical protein